MMTVLKAKWSKCSYRKIQGNPAYFSTRICYFYRVNLVSCRECMSWGVSEGLVVSTLAARSRIRLCESNFGEWQVGACKRERSGWQNRKTRPPEVPADFILFRKSEKKLFRTESPIYYDRHTRGSQLPCFWCRSLIPFTWKVD